MDAFQITILILFITSPAISLWLRTREEMPDRGAWKLYAAVAYFYAFIRVFLRENGRKQPKNGLAVLCYLHGAMQESTFNTDIYS